MKIYLFAFLYVFSINLYAISLSEKLTLNGFATVGAAYNDDDNAIYLRSIAQPPEGLEDDVTFNMDSRVGLQLNYQANENLHAGLQVVSKYRYDDTYTPDITWAYLKFSPESDWDLRLGRLGLDIFFRSDSRDIGYSYLWVRPPVDYYGQLNISSFDGLDFSHYIPMGDGLLKLKGFAGVGHQKFPAFGGNQLDLSDSPVYGFLAQYQDINWTYKFVISEQELNDQDPTVDQLVNFFELINRPDYANSFQLDGKTFRYYSLGVAYDKGPWRSQFALGYIDSENIIVSDNKTAYFSLGYKLNDWTPYLLLSASESDKPTVTSGLGPPTDALIASALGGGQVDQTTVGFGARYDFKENMALKFQADFVESKTDTLLLWGSGDDISSWDGENMIISVTLDMVF